MTPITLLFLFISVIFLFVLPKRWALLPFIVACCYLTYGQMITVAGFNFTVIRILIPFGLLRILIRGERLHGGMITLDWMMIWWSVWAISSSFFHEEFRSALIWRLGWVYNVNGIYIIIRVLCQNIDEIEHLFRITAISLAPLALAMIYEHMAGHNLFSYLGGVGKTPMFREGSYRAQGPFRHAILAGTVGAVCFPLMVSLWIKSRNLSILGVLSCLGIVFSCGSSGPLIGIFSGTLAMVLFKIRHQMKIIRLMAVAAYIALDLVMKAPAYYVMARLPFTGGGWHRARLIEVAFSRLDEWWLGGTDYTRHWMPTGVSWNPNHTDITNQYIGMGVRGGLPLMLLFIATLYVAFQYVGYAIKNSPDQSKTNLFFIWAIGSSLFANAAIMISVSYFDQSYIFLYITLAAIGSLRSQLTKNNEE